MADPKNVTGLIVTTEDKKISAWLSCESLEVQASWMSALTSQISSKPTTSSFGKKNSNLLKIQMNVCKVLIVCFSDCSSYLSSTVLCRSHLTRQISWISSWTYNNDINKTNEGKNKNINISDRLQGRILPYEKNVNNQWWTKRIHLIHTCTVTIYVKKKLNNLWQILDIRISRIDQPI